MVAVEQQKLHFLQLRSLPQAFRVLVEGVDGVDWKVIPNLLYRLNQP